MATTKIVVEFFGTGGIVSSRDGEVVKIRNKRYPNIRRKEFQNGTECYCFSGPNIFDVGSTNIENNIKNAVTLLSNRIDNWAHENKDAEDAIMVFVRGHSRGGVAATRVAYELRDMYKKDRRISILLRASDPYAGPTHTGKNVSIDLKRNDEMRNDNDDIIFYSMGTTFSCSPQKIMNARTVVICEMGHNSTGWMMDNLSTNEYNRLKRGGVYLITLLPTKLTEVTKENLKQTMDIIYNWKKSYSARTRVLTEVIVKKLGLNIDDVLETGAVREWKPAFDKALKSIEKSKLLRTAFSCVTELFSDELFGPYINKKGRFFRCLETAKAAVVGVGNNDYDTALRSLEIIIRDSKHKYKQDIARALQARIINYYKLASF